VCMCEGVGEVKRDGSWFSPKILCVCHFLNIQWMPGHGGDVEP
jgi:hypothetical protein